MRIFVILHFEYLVMAPKGAEARAPDSRTGASALQRSSKLGNKLDEVTSSCKAPLTCDTEVNDVIGNSLFYTNPINLSGEVELMGCDRVPFLPLFLPWAAAEKLAVHCICQRCSPAKSVLSLYKNPVLETTNKMILVQVPTLTQATLIDYSETLTSMNGEE